MDLYKDGEFVEVVDLFMDLPEHIQDKIIFNLMDASEKYCNLSLSRDGAIALARQYIYKHGDTRTVGHVNNVEIVDN